MISLIIPAYYANQELVETTARCLYSLHTTDWPDEVILVDDGSPIEPEFQFETIDVRLPENQGYSAATNIGLEASTGDVIIIGNNDLTFPKNWLRELLRPLEEGFDVSCCWSSDQKFKIEPVIKEADKFGSLFAMRRSVYEDIGGFDEQFRGYFSDDDYRQRLKQKGYRIGKNHLLVVGHVAKATYSVTDPEDNEYKKARLLYEVKWGLE